MSRPFPQALESAVIRLAKARAIIGREGDDVCGCRMAAIECTIVSALKPFEAKNYEVRQSRAWRS